MTYYAVAKGRVPGIYLTWKECKLQVHKFGGAKYKGFQTLEEANEFYQIHHPGSAPKIMSKKKPKSSKSMLKPKRICLCCEKPFGGRTKLCPTCRKITVGIRVKNVVAIKTLYPDDTIAKTLETKPWVKYDITQKMSSKERAMLRTEKHREYRSEEYRAVKYRRQDSTIPDYIKALFDKNPSKELLHIDGDRINPNIYYRCKRCEQEHCQTYESLAKGYGHNCEAIKSSGEAVVGEFLRETGYSIRTQHDTLKCVNPKTKKTMPYDFEVRGKKLIIEVQGEQHDMYIPYFHGSEENFEYQMWKDKYKKEFAETKGYRVLYLHYEDIKNGKYKEMINESLMRKQGEPHE